jgi:hypothetical protein
LRRWHVLAELINENDFRCGAEIGVNQGVNMKMVLSLCPNFSWIGVDDWRAGYLGWNEAKRKDNRRNAMRVFQNYSNRARLIESDSIDAATLVEDGSLDLVFIDADHSYEGVRKDIEAWSPKVRKGGVIAGHDYGHPDFPDVKVAVDEFCEPETGAEWVWWTRS